MKQVLITIENKHHLETELINEDGHTFTYNPTGRNEGLEDFFISAPESDTYNLLKSLTECNEKIKSCIEWKSKDEIGHYIYENLKKVYRENEIAINNFLKQDAHLTEFSA